ncbi:hypothetical protein [Phormidium pseudopriestleyi]|uniref:hypothetical protein n=1 Tax=Phormidium pseudopriestleyi TaxID=1759527 RepID=UPI001A8D49C1|nr:hypothetical protein [Phormidium pseudopriestleyi]
MAIATSRTHSRRSRLYGGGCQPLSTRKCDRTSLRHSTHRFHAQVLKHLTADTPP